MILTDRKKTPFSLIYNFAIFPVDNGGQDSGGLNTQVVLIIVSLLIIMVLICVVAFLVYKVKMHKLTMQYEARARQLQTNALMANHGVK